MTWFKIGCGSVLALFAVIVLLGYWTWMGWWDQFWIDYLGSATHTGEEEFVLLSASNTHTCGLRTDGSVRCWGRLYLYGSNMPDPAERLVTLSVGLGHGCGLREDGSAVCWGQDGEDGRTRPPEGARYAAISLARNTSCGLRADGGVDCWGEFPGLSKDDGIFASISVGNGFACGLREDGLSECWGVIEYWKRINGGDVRARLSAPSDIRFSVLESGIYEKRACGVSRPGGDLVCWGNVGYMKPPAPGVVVVEGDYVDLSMGRWHVCGLDEGGTATCHFGMSAPCGMERRCPVAVPSVEFLSIASGTDHACGIRREDGRVACWSWAHENSGRDALIGVP